LNYRTTEQIGKWATQLLQGITVDDMDGEVDTLKGYRALVSGPDPVDLRSLVPEEKLTKIREILTQMDESQRSSTCLALPSQDAVHEWKKNLKSWGIEAEIIDKNSDITSKKSSVNIATIHRIKGLEFDTVVVKLPSEDMRNAKALGFVAATRARKELVIL
jgi:DNA helicase IV